MHANLADDGSIYVWHPRLTWIGYNVKKMRMPQKIQMNDLICSNILWYNDLVKKLRMPQKFHGGYCDAVCEEAIYGSADPEKG